MGVVLFTGLYVGAYAAFAGARILCGGWSLQKKF